MNFKSLINIEKAIPHKENKALKSFKLEMLSEYIEKEEKKAISISDPFIYYYEDVISSALDFDFKKSLDNVTYSNASDDAQTCLEICNEFSKITKYSICGWLQNALKFIDNIVLHYIQEVCKETPIKYKNCGVEKSRYYQLKSKKNNISIAAWNMLILHEIRSNHLEHRTKIHNDGRQEILPPQRNEIRKAVIKFYPEILIIFLKNYKVKLKNNSKNILQK